MVQRDSSVHRLGATASRIPRVAIIGGGMSGICVAVSLVLQGLRDVVIFEKAQSYGGTWRDNVYPGLTCDVPSRFYQFSFAKSPDWTRFMAEGAEINRYFAGVACRYGLPEVTRFGCEVTDARFDGRRWSLTTSVGEIEEFDFVVCATGILHQPRIPPIPGLAEFEGPAFHSSRWETGIDLNGKRVGVIGSGSSGVQIVTALAGVAQRVVMFNRSPQWVLRVPNPRYPQWASALRRRLPALDLLSYLTSQWVSEFSFHALIAPGWRRWLVRWTCRRQTRGIRDERLRTLLTPRDEPMCKRLIVSAGYRDAVQRDDVEITGQAIDRIDASGVTMADRTRHELDVLVLATGFDTLAYMRPMRVQAPGRDLDDEWGRNPRAFETISVPGYPNLFVMIGPHSPVGNFPLTAIAEWQSEHIVNWVKRWRGGEFTTVEPTAEATADFYDRLQRQFPETVWVSGCSSWYLDESGAPMVWPWSPSAHRRLMRRAPDDRNYHFDRLIGDNVE